MAGGQKNSHCQLCRDCLPPGVWSPVLLGVFHTKVVIASFFSPCSMSRRVACMKVNTVCNSHGSNEDAPKAGVPEDHLEYDFTMCIFQVKLDYQWTHTVSECVSCNTRLQTSEMCSQTASWTQSFLHHHLKCKSCDKQMESMSEFCSSLLVVTQATPSYRAVASYLKVM